MNNQELYRKSLSRLHASEAVTTEVEEMRNIKSKVRFPKAMAACMALLIFAGASSGITYAATDGATANPIKAITIYINGEAIDGDIYKNDDGTYTIDLESGDSVKVTDGSDQQNATEVDIQSSDEVEGVETTVTMTTTTSGSIDGIAVEVTDDAQPDGNADAQ